MEVNELIVVTKSPDSNKYIVVEGNNRHEASLKFCRENKLDESKAFVYALEVVIKDEHDFGLAVGSLGQQYNLPRLAQVTNNPELDAIAWGKMAIKAKLISKNTSRAEIERLLTKVQGFRFGDVGVVTRVVNKILDPGYQPSNYVRLNSADASQIVAKFDFLGTSKSRKGRDIRALSPLNPGS